MASTEQRIAVLEMAARAPQKGNRTLLLLPVFNIFYFILNFSVVVNTFRCRRTL